MALPVVVGAAGTAAGAAVVGWLTSAATGAAVDAILDHTIGSLGSDGEIATSPTTPNISVDPVITIINEPSGANVQQEVQIGPAGGPPDARFGLIRIADQPAGNAGATASDFESIAVQDGGNSALRAMRDAVEATPSQAEVEQSMLSGGGEQQQAIARAARAGLRPRVGLQRQNQRLGSLADRSRTSMEYHEWAHNVRVTSPPQPISNAELASTEVAVILKYVGPDPISPDLPPYHAWVQYEDYRKLINIVKKYRRLRSACGGKALWAEQGFASKTAAIADDCANDSEYTSLHSALVATADWSAI